MELFKTDKVLVPIDFSEASFETLEQTLEFLKNPTNLYILYVLPPLSPMEPGVIWETIDDEARKKNVEESFYQKCPGAKYQQINFTVTIGQPGSEIIDYANKEGIGLIVIPCHGRTGINRFFMGSVAERVVRHAHCPVLVTRRSPEN